MKVEATDYTSNPVGHDINPSMCRLVRNVLAAVKNGYAEQNNCNRRIGCIPGDSEEMSIFWKMIVSVVVRIKVDMNVCLILNGYRYSTVLIPRPDSVKFLFGGWMKNEDYERKVDTRDE